jgi:hypothetical protein
VSTTEIPFTCDTCYDTGTIDTEGREIACPDCAPTLRISGLSHGIGSFGDRYATAVRHTDSSITFAGTRAQILADVAAVRSRAVTSAKIAGENGRTNISSWAIAIEKRVRAAAR